MSNHNFRRRSKYDKEMEQAFTLIFHNIKRLQDGQLCERGASHVSFDNQADLAPSLQRPRARSDPLNGPADGVLRQNMNHESGTRPKSRSFSGGKGSSPSSQGRKVTFADDYTAKDPTTAKKDRPPCKLDVNLAIFRRKYKHYVMRDHNHTEDMSHNCPPSRRHSTYHKEMDHAFTLIFHNIKRLQDDRLCNSTPDMTQSQDDQRESIKPAMSLTVPSLQRTRCKSDPLLKIAENEIEKHAEFFDGRVKSRSFCGTEASPLQRRKVRFADDYEMKDRRIDRQRPVLTTRPWSNLQPLIVVTKES